MERETGFEPATLALARQCSTTELFPQYERTKEQVKIYYILVNCQQDNDEIIHV